MPRRARDGPGEGEFTLASCRRACAGLQGGQPSYPQRKHRMAGFPRTAKLHLSHLAVGEGRAGAGRARPARFLEPLAVAEPCGANCVYCVDAIFI